MAIRPAHGWRIIGVAVAGGLLCAACGSSTTSSPGGGASPSPSPTPAAATSPPASPASAVCQDAAALHASVDKLLHVRIGKGTVDEIKSDVADVKAQLSALTASAHGQMQAQTSAVKAALDKVEKAVSDMSSHFSASTVKGVATALAGLSSAVGTLLTSLDPQCPNLSASPSPSA